ncbi:MAG: ATP-binding protein [Dehalococcoidia bacterium]|nr:ATP-binding protein [Dehalococcoidia bacterium]
MSTTDPFDTKESLQNQRLGVIVGGSLSEGLIIRLDPQIAVEDMAVGRFITMQGAGKRFIGLVADVSLADDPSLSQAAPEANNPFISKVLSATYGYSVIKVKPYLIIGGTAEAILDGPQPAKTIPGLFTAAAEASQSDVETIFGKDDDKHLWIGSPLDMECNLNLNVEEAVRRSNGIFGKSGTGKTFLARILLAGIVQKGRAVNLVFDMHSEYGWGGKREDGTQVKGLKALFSSKVAVFTLDPDRMRARGVSADHDVTISYDDIEPEDISLLKNTLNLSDPAADCAYVLANRFGNKWFSKFMAMDTGDFETYAKSINVNEQALRTLHRRLQQLTRLKFLRPDSRSDSVNAILSNLNGGRHVVLEFGGYGDDLKAYILVANLLTRRIHEKYREQVEAAMGERSKEPTPLVITIEEAHKYLTPGIAGQTIFGTIAREMRKYNVTLLIVDQRPSEIDDEVMSQLGTKFTCQLDNEKDVDAVLSGASGRSELRSVLSRLESKQQALVFGHAVPMPVVVRVRDYGTLDSYKSFGWKEQAEAMKQSKSEVDKLWGKS